MEHIIVTLALLFVLRVLCLEFCVGEGSSLNEKSKGFKQCDVYLFSLNYDGTWLCVHSLHLVHEGNVWCLDDDLIERRSGKFIGCCWGQFAILSVFVSRVKISENSLKRQAFNLYT